MTRAPRSECGARDRFPVNQVQTPSRHPDVVSSHLAGGELVLLHLESGEYHELNPVGAAIWKLVDGTRTASGIASELRSRVEDAPPDLESVVAGYLAQLRERDLLL